MLAAYSELVSWYMVWRRSSSARSSFTSQVLGFTPTENSKSSLVIESQNCRCNVSTGAAFIVVVGEERRKSYLVNHHHRQQIAESGEKETIQVMLHIVANSVAECVE